MSTAPSGPVTIVCVTPWLIYVQWFEGLGEYFASALRFVAAEGRRTAATPEPLFYAMAVVPL